MNNHKRVKDMLVSDSPLSQESIAAMMKTPLNAEAVNLSLCVLRHSVNKTIAMLLAPAYQQIYELKGADNWISAYIEYGES